MYEARKCRSAHTCIRVHSRNTALRALVSSETAFSTCATAVVLKAFAAAAAAACYKTVGHTVTACFIATLSVLAAQLQYSTCSLQQWKHTRHAAQLISHDRTVKNE
jgi:hypothetical protein